MDPLHIALIVLVIAAIWAVVELALTFKKTRNSIEEVTRSANETIEQVQPVLTKVDGMVDELQPSVKQVPELLQKAQTAVGAATIDLVKVGDILDDVSDVSGVAASATTAASSAVDAAANGVSGLVSKITGRPTRASKAVAAGQDKARLEDGAHFAEDNLDEQQVASSSSPSQRSYVTYDQLSSKAGEDTDDQDQDSASEDAKKNSEQGAS
jgi:uncharacterized protein YoxC